MYIEQCFQYFRAKDNVKTDNLMRQFTVGPESKSAKTQENIFTHSISIDTCTDGLDIHEIAELKQDAVDQEQGNTVKMKSKAQKKLDQEKAIQRE